MSKKILLSLLGVYAASAVLSYSAFAFSSRAAAERQEAELAAESAEETDLAALLQVDAEAPRDQACPLNGELYTQAEREAWEQRRPLAVMIENSPDARPQSGLSDADIMFEAVAEYGVTRFMGIYYCGVQRYDATLAPVRSARTYFIDWASGFNDPMYVHVGGANTPGPADALGQINDYGWALENDINQFSVGYPTFVRNFNRIPGKQIATEHTMETTTEGLWAVAEQRGWTNMSPERQVGRLVVESTDWAEGYDGWAIEGPDADTTPGEVTTVSYDFWSGYEDFAVQWTYNAESGAYLRNMAGEPHIDANNDQQLEYANVIVLQTLEKGPIDELKHMLYTTKGSGKATLFKHGRAEKINWRKLTREAELEFTDLKGSPVELAPGKVWISVLDTADTIDY